MPEYFLMESIIELWTLPKTYYLLINTTQTIYYNYLTTNPYNLLQTPISSQPLQNNFALKAILWAVARNYY